MDEATSHLGRALLEFANAASEYMIRNGDVFHAESLAVFLATIASGGREGRTPDVVRATGVVYGNLSNAQAKAYAAEWANPKDSHATEYVPPPPHSQFGFSCWVWVVGLLGWMRLDEVGGGWGSLCFG